MSITPQVIQTLLKELYASDPLLKEREKELIQLIKTIAEAKPDATINATFITSLRSELMKKAKALSPSMKSPQPVMAQKPSKFWPILGVAFSGIAVVIMAALFMTQNMVQFQKGAKTTSNQSQNYVAFQAVQINHLEKQAFGLLSVNSNGSGEKGLNAAVGMGGNAGMMAAGRSATYEGASAPAVPPTAVGAVQANDAAVSAPAPSMAKIMPPYEQTIIEYTYNGDPIELKDASLDVYKRTNASFSTGSLASLVQGMNFGILNLSTFNNVSVSDISVYQNEPFGYQIYISPRNGAVSIDQNWEQWQSAYPNCMDEACAQANQLKESDVPSNEELIGIADAFLSAHGINLTSYGKGEVDESWRMNQPVPMMVDSKQVMRRYVPDMMQVVYPLIVNGQTVYQNGGGKTGVMVSINLRVKKVSSVYGLQASTFDASSYDAITDSNAILDSAKNGGLASPIRYMDATTLNAAKKVQAELGTPTRGLVQTYQYKDNQSLELYVPALIFPVTKKADSDQVWTPNIVIVPLVKGIESDGPRILPMMKGAGVESSATGSAGSSAGTEVVPPTPAVEPMMKAQ